MAEGDVCGVSKRGRGIKDVLRDVYFKYFEILG